jgi:hypothetical protein
MTVLAQARGHIGCRFSIVLDEQDLHASILADFPSGWSWT